MCGILAYLNNIENSREYFLKEVNLLDIEALTGMGYNPENDICICHERLSIVGIDNGSQPIISKCGNYVLSINGEIYNYKNLLQNVLHDRYDCVTTSDCEVIIYLYQEFGINFIKMLDGIFSFILYDIAQNKVIISRDPIGILPLYCAKNLNNTFMLSSEFKSFENESLENIWIVPPGTYTIFDFNTSWNIEHQDILYYTPKWKLSKFDTCKDEETICKNINIKLTESVKKD